MFGGLLAVVAPVMADPVDNPGIARFSNDTGPYPFLKLPNGEWLSTGAGPMDPQQAFLAQVDSAGNLTFLSASIPYLPSVELIGAVPVEVQLVIEDITGTVNFASGDSIAWMVTARLAFQTSSVSGDTCRTDTFTFELVGELTGGANKDFFVPVLTGSGTGACNGYAAEINADFNLGTYSAGEILIDKWSAINALTLAPLIGS